MIKKYIYKIVLVVIAFLCITGGSYAQYSSEEELKSAANEMFEEGDYTGSIKLFSQLLSTYPKDPNYNYKYGTCVLYGSRDKGEALRFLKFAVTNSNVDPIAFYFLGKAYHHEYDFALAIDNYNKFKEKSSTKEQKKYEIDREIRMCENGARLLKSMADIGVLSKKEIKESDFFRSYKLSGIGGKVIVKPEQFQTKLDKKKKEKSVVYLGEAKDMVLFSSYGKDGMNGKDIYKAVKLSNGSWGEPELFSSNVNSKYDEDYPFLHPDGKTLYFSSKGFSSMGGYDIFKSTLNEVTREWSTPKNLDFPINTPDDDILYISDAENKLAYFASSRASKQGELTVYNVTVNSVPVNHSVIKGFFVSESNPVMKSAKITIRAVDKDRRYGVYETHEVSGEYLLMFPTNGGKFKILVETTDDAPVHSAIIEIPELDGFRALKQELRLVGEGDEEKLVVKNLFDESDEFSIEDPLVVQNILKERAKMEVNTTEAEVDSLAKARKEDEIVASNNLNNSLATSLNNALKKSVYQELSDDEVISKSDETASKIINQAKISKEKSIASYQIADEKSNEAKLLYGESEKLLVESESTSSETEKKQKITLAESKKLAAAKLINEVVAALSLAKTLDNEVVERGSDLEKVKLLQKSITANIENEERSLAETDLKKLDEIASASYHNESALDTETKILEDKLLEEEKKYSNASEYVVDLQDREVDLRTSIKKLEEKKSTIKKKKEIEAINERIKSLTIDVEDTQFDLENARKKAEKAKVPYLKVKNESATTKSVIAMINDENNEVVEITSPEKLQIENDIIYFEKEGLVGLYPDEESSVIPTLSETTYNLEEHKGEYEIINDDGEIVDYNTSYTAKLTEDVKETANPKERDQIIVEIYESWINDIDDEINIRKQQLASEESEEKKNEYKSKIAALEVLKSEKQGELEEYDQVLAEEPVVTEEPVSYSEKHTAALANFSGEDTYESSTLKAAVHENWAKDIEEEIVSKRADLSIASSEKKMLENEIVVLENDLLEQEEFASLYALQAESLQSETSEVVDPVVTEEPEVTEPVVTEPVVDKGEPEVTEPTVTTEEPTSYSEKHTAALANFSGEDTYESSTLKAAVHENWVKDIEEEIASKRTDLSISSGSEKKGIENEIAVLENDLLEQEEFVSLYALQAESLQSETTEVVEPVITEEPEVEPEVTEPVVSKEEPAITTEEPASYSEKHTAALANFSGEDTYESSTLKAAVHENWAKDIEEEIVSKRADLSITSGSEKKGIENEIAVLENDLLEQEEFASLYALQAESLQSETTEVVDPVVTEEPEVTEPVVTEPVVDKGEPEVTEPTVTTEEPTSYSEKHTAALANFSGEDTYESSTLKAAVHENWVKDIEEEIVSKRADLSITSGSEKKGIENEIAVLENDLLEQEEFASLYALQAESLQSETTEVVEPVITEEPEVEPEVTEPVVDKGEPEITEPTVTTEEPSVESSNELSEENLTENNLNGEEDGFSNLKYNNKFNYKSPQSRNALEKITALKSEARNLKEEAEVKLNEASNTSDETEKSKLIAEAEELSDKSNRKQESIAKVYEGANRSEYYNNQSVVTELKKDNTIKPIDKTIAELMMDEANNYYDEAKLKRKEAVDAPDFPAKERLLQQAYELEMKAIEAQKRAILKLGGKDVYLAVADSDSGTVKDENVVDNNEVITSSTEEPVTKTRTTEINEELTTADKDVVSAMEVSEIKAVKEEGDYKEYVQLKKKKRRLIKEAQVEYVKAEQIEADIEDQKQLIAGLNTVDEASESQEQKTTREYQIKEIEKLIAENNVQVLALREAARAKEAEAKKASDKSEFILINADENVAKNYTAIEKAETFDGEFMAKVMSKTSTSVVSDNEVITTKPTLANIDVIPTVLKESIFVINNNKAAYNENKKIPVSPKLPEGLVFKVQIGAFRNPISQSHFKGFAPIMAEDAGGGITRYTAGLFKTFNMANEAKGSIRSIGYSDAFVVAFFNGKRINMTKAREMLDGGSIDEGSLADNTSNTGSITNNITDNSTTSKIVTKEVKDGISTDVRNIGGVFYAVQVGVYSKQVTKGQLNNVTPLNSERTASGLIRYTSGVYKTLDEANAAKDRIRADGIPDAFVVAYNNGSKITILKAKWLTENNDPVVPTKETPKEIVPEEVTPEKNIPEENLNEEEAVKEVVEEGPVVTEEPKVTEPAVTTEESATYREKHTAALANLSGEDTYESSTLKAAVHENWAKDIAEEITSKRADLSITSGSEKKGIENEIAVLENDLLEQEEFASLYSLQAESLQSETTEVVEPVVTEEPVVEDEVVVEEIEEVTEEINEEAVSISSPTNNLKIKFKVKLGEYTDGVPVEEAGVFLKLTGRGIKNYEENGKTIYIIGSFSDYAEATDLKIEMKEMGVINPEVVAFKSGEEISVNEALELIGK